MDFVKNAMSGDKQGENTQQGQNAQSSSGGGGFLGGLGDKFNSAAGGGKESEKNEDLLDKGAYSTCTFLVSKSYTLYTYDLYEPHWLISIMFASLGIDAVQQYGFGQGDQSNESTFEQAKDEQISDGIRRQFKSSTGQDIPIKDKETRFG